MMTSADAKRARPFAYSSRADRLVTVASSQDGVVVSLVMTAETASKLAREIEEEVAKLPRVGTAADLGCEAL